MTIQYHPYQPQVKGCFDYGTCRNFLRTALDDSGLQTDLNLGMPVFRGPQTGWFPFGFPLKSPTKRGTLKKRLWTLLLVSLLNIMGTQGVQNKLILGCTCQVVDTYRHDTNSTRAFFPLSEAICWLLGKPRLRHLDPLIQVKLPLGCC